MTEASEIAGHPEHDRQPGAPSPSSRLSAQIPHDNSPACAIAYTNAGSHERGSAGRQATTSRGCPPPPPRGQAAQTRVSIVYTNAGPHEHGATGRQVPSRVRHLPANPTLREAVRCPLLDGDLRWPVLAVVTTHGPAQTYAHRRSVWRLHRAGGRAWHGRPPRRPSDPHPPPGRWTAVALRKREHLPTGPDRSGSVPRARRPLLWLYAAVHTREHNTGTDSLCVPSAGTWKRQDRAPSPTPTEGRRQGSGNTR